MFHSIVDSFIPQLSLAPTILATRVMFSTQPCIFEVSPPWAPAIDAARSTVTRAAPIVWTSRFPDISTPA
jgi:hypothetical protein